MLHDATMKKHSCIQFDSIYLYLYGICKHGACVSVHVVAVDLILYWCEQVLDNLPLPTFMMLRLSSHCRNQCLQRTNWHLLYYY